MGTRKATILIGWLISLLVSIAPRDLGGLGVLALGFSLPAAARPVDDLYLDFNPASRRLIATRRGQVFLVTEARNDSVRPGQYGRWGHCPPGWFRVGPPVATPGSVKFGPAFLGLFDTGKGGPMARFGRSGIGIHGGGTGLKNPLAPNQGWLRTLGCIRLQNQSMNSLLHLVHWTRKGGGRVWIRVAPNPRVR